MLYIQLLLAVGLLSAHSVLSIKFQDAVDACAKQFGVDANLENINLKDPDLSHEHKCAMACLLEKKDVLRADGSIDKEKEKDLIEEAIKEEDLRKKYLKAVAECDTPVKADKCETAYEFVKCKTTKAGD